MLLGLGGVISAALSGDMILLAGLILTAIFGTAGLLMPVLVDDGLVAGAASSALADADYREAGQQLIQAHQTWLATWSRR